MIDKEKMEEILRPIMEYEEGFAKWASPELETKDLIAVSNGENIAAIRKMTPDQYAILDLTIGRYKVVSTVKQAVREYNDRILLSDCKDWENKFFGQEVLNQILSTWQSHVRRLLCEGTKSWVKEERSRRISIVIAVLGLLVLPLGFYGVDFRLLAAFALICGLLSWLRVRQN
jgi:hypothetical protein